MLKRLSLAKWGVAVLLLSSLSSCEDILEQYFPKPTPPTIPAFPSLGLDIPFYALAEGNRLDAYSTKDPATRTASVAITGLQPGERLLAIDFRPGTGQLYGIGDFSRLYVINQTTGVARGVDRFNRGGFAFSPTLASDIVSFDFDPRVDLIRLVTSTGQNLRIDPVSGTVANIFGRLTGAAGATITGAAYSNNTAWSSATFLYTLDPATDKLYRLEDAPNEAPLVEIGALNLNISGDGGFDIDAKTNTALGLYAVDGGTTLFTVSTQTGATQVLAKYDASLGYRGLAIPTQPVAYAVYTSSAQDAPGQPFYAVNNLLTFDLSNPASNLNRPIAALPRNEEIIGMDMRPATGQLYVLTRQRDQGQLISSARLYTIDFASTATVTAAVATIVNPLTTNLNALTVGFDFNPVTDRIRIVTDQAQNLNVDPNNGLASVEGSLPRTTFATAAAYSNNFAGATTSNLYILNRSFVNPIGTTSKLYLVNPPSAGTPTEIGDLNFTGFNIANFDIGGNSNTGYGIFQDTGGKTYLYDISLTTGSARRANLFDFSSLNNLGQLNGFTVGLGF